MDGGDDRCAVVFVQAVPRQVLARAVHALQDAFQRLPLAPQGAGDQAVEVNALAREILAQAHALPAAEVAELVIVVGAERGLPVPNQIKSSHARDSGGAGRGLEVAPATNR